MTMCEEPVLYLVEEVIRFLLPQDFRKCLAYLELTTWIAWRGSISCGINASSQEYVSKYLK